MEEHLEGRCNVVYYCGGLRDEVCEVYHAGSLPERESAKSEGSNALDVVHGNVHALLDEDQGGLDEVFVSSSAKQCHDRLEVYANSVPTVVLVELLDDDKEGSDALPLEKRANTFSFLRALAADIHGARYQRQVMPFALVSSVTPGMSASIGTALTTTCLNAGALDIVHSPLGDEDLHRLVGHVMEALRPVARLVGAGMAQNLVDSIRDTKPTTVARHRPDQTVPLERRSKVGDAVGRWQFPAQDFTMDELAYAAVYMLEHMLQVPELEPYRIPRAELMNFVLATRRHYKHQREVHYHNWRHAVDVTQSLYCFLLDVRLCPPLETDTRPPKHLNALERLLTPLDALILLISAIGHDVGHPGVNNAFLIACNHPLAQMYNDKSVLENYHCAAYSQLLRRHWPSLGRISGFRSTMISTILATDMQRHFEYMSNLGDLKHKIEGSEIDLSDWCDKEREQKRELMMALLIKAADISNVARPFDISSQWARTLMDEFCRQGELEAELGIPTCLFGGPPNKEDALAAAQSQKGFMSLFGIPLFSGMHEIMPSVSCAIKELENNSEVWGQKIALEKQKRDFGGESALLTFQSVSKADVDEAKIRHRKSEPLAVPQTLAQAPSSPTKRQQIIESGLAHAHHPANRQRHHLSTGLGHYDHEHASSSTAIPLSPNGNASRRSSKDVALDSLQQLTAYAHSNLGPGSRRGSADAGWQMHQSYPESRRGSKDESLTTILVTSQGSTGRTSPASPGRTPRPSGSGSPGKVSRKRYSIPQGAVQDAASRYSVPSSRSHTTSSATANTTQRSPSTQPSSLAPTDDEPTPPANYGSIAATEDPFLVPGTWPTNLDGTRHASAPAIIPNIPPLPNAMSAKSDSPRIMSRMASGDSEDASNRGTPRQDRGIRESRSRSRLRGLKFWKKKREVSGVETGEAGSP
ncbi:3',5'-cyclic-nucleotide phosphodiesterase [Elasticomyces elasticus]|nr:3',5'-cyclic-nucleotide phosphodiesterase [Elasticomyces elasticus]KAK4912967.1 3',5'-cyclic-nucleotide phosphodiesterase [Elasticomyces elasticus]KAK5752374.1 3',5'-cyclic-nucleotide phosphodiesterase [Elasticomyces elasticus]